MVKCQKCGALNPRADGVTIESICIYPPVHTKPEKMVPVDEPVTAPEPEAGRFLEVYL